LTGVEVEGSTIPEAVPVEGVMPETQEATGAATESAQIAGREAPGVAEEVRDDVLPESSLEVVIRLLQIQDAEPIRLAPMSEAATSSRGGIEILADDLVHPAAVACNLEAMRLGMKTGRENLVPTGTMYHLNRPWTVLSGKVGNREKTGKTGGNRCEIG
jgi:hypothetical protein